MKTAIFLAIVVLVLVAGLLLVKSNQDSAAVKTDLIEVSTPALNEIIKSPLFVRGRARGTWYFEASFPVTLLDARGEIIAQSYAEAKADWMTTDWVPFEARVEFTVPTGATAGRLVLEKDNPSGLPEHADAIELPVRF